MHCTNFFPLRGNRMQPNEDTTIAGKKILKEYMFFFRFFRKVNFNPL